MPFRLKFTSEADAQLAALASDPKKLKKVRRCLGLLETDPRYPGLHSHKYAAMKTPDGRDVWESYVENRTPSAWRVFWCYGPGGEIITILAIVPHP